MGKFGLLFELVGFLMLFWKAEMRPGRDIEAGGGVTQHGFEESMQIEKALSWVPDRATRKFVAEHFNRVALGFVLAGVALQFLSCR